jgi:hypothetical protein
VENLDGLVSVLLTRWLLFIIKCEN